MRTMWMNVNTGTALGNLRFVMGLTKNAQEDGFFFYERLAGGSTLALATADSKVVYSAYRFRQRILLRGFM